MTLSSTTNLAEITTGFINRIGALGPLVAFAAPDLKLTALVQLEKPEKSVFVDFGARPMAIEMGTSKEKADVTFATDADSFHYILWGDLLVTRAINEWVLLLQIKTGSLPDVPTTGTPKKKEKPPGKNKLYEAYLINIGAGHLLDDPKGFVFPPDPEREVRSIELHPREKSSILAKVVYFIALVMGFVGGLILRLFRKRIKPPKPRTPKVEILTFDEVFKPPPPPAPASKGPGPIADYFFSRVDIFTMLEYMVRGVKASGALKKPLQLMPTLAETEA